MGTGTSEQNTTLVHFFAMAFHSFPLPPVPTPDIGNAEQALQQIDEKGYLIPYQVDGRELVKVGVEFSAEKRNIDRWLY